jgi:hypothetical protein
MQEDSPWQVSVGSSHPCCLWAHEQSHMAAPWECVLANLSGVWCLEAVPDRGRTILVATAPLGDLTGSCNLGEPNDQGHRNAF